MNSLSNRGPRRVDKLAVAAVVGRSSHYEIYELGRVHDVPPSPPGPWLAPAASCAAERDGKGVGM